MQRRLLANINIFEPLGYKNYTVYKFGNAVLFGINVKRLGATAVGIFTFFLLIYPNKRLHVANSDEALFVAPGLKFLEEPWR